MFCFSFAVVIPLLSSLFQSLILALPTTLNSRSTDGPVISTNFQDSCLIQVAETWYSFAGANGNPAGINVQMATSPDFSTWTLFAGYDALPAVGAWAASPPHVWAPDVNQMPSGEFVMYYSASVASSPAQHCVGAAVSTSIEGPYVPLNTPFACDLATGGTIDPDGFHDPLSDTQWVVYKVDGNSLGHGGACKNTVQPIIPTPILLQQVSANDGTTSIGPAYEILVNDASDGADIEAPALIYSPETKTYTLFYSSGCFEGTQYKVMYATSSSLTGPYVKNFNPLLVTGSTAADVYIPGGIDLSSDGTRAVFQGDLNLGWFNNDGSKRVRGMYAASLTQIQGTPPTVSVAGLF